MIKKLLRLIFNSENDHQHELIYLVSKKKGTMRAVCKICKKECYKDMKPWAEWEFRYNKDGTKLCAEEP